jgi:ribonuclease J
MRVCIHRGSKQIGGSCVEVESLGQRLLIDLGLPLDAENNSIEYLPAVAGLDGNDPSLLGIFISHPHLTILDYWRMSLQKFPSEWDLQLAES